MLRFCASAIGVVMQYLIRSAEIFAGAIKAREFKDGLSLRWVALQAGTQDEFNHGIKTARLGEG